MPSALCWQLLHKCRSPIRRRDKKPHQNLSLLTCVNKPGHCNSSLQFLFLEELNFKHPTSNKNSRHRALSFTMPQIFCCFWSTGYRVKLQGQAVGNRVALVLSGVPDINCTSTSLLVHNQNYNVPDLKVQLFCDSVKPHPVSSVVKAAFCPAVRHETSTEIQAGQSKVFAIPPSGGLLPGGQEQRTGKSRLKKNGAGGEDKKKQRSWEASYQLYRATAERAHYIV